MNRSMKTKITVIAVLSCLILMGLAYLKFFGKVKPSAPVRPTASATASAVPETPAAETPSETPEETPEATPESTPVPTPAVPDADITSDDSMTRLLNKTYTVSSSYVPQDLRTVNVRSDHPQTMRSEAADAMEKMMSAALNDGITLKLVSGYRSYREQTSLYNTYLYRYGKQKTSLMDATPGASEHQLGLAADLGNWSGNCELNTCFAGYPTYTWLQDHAHEYGFIERYPSGKENITGIMGSPWHWRYVGVEEAGRIKASGLTMEEYYGKTN
ncbi:MAG: D-alanyl-D-alanine carboxypeptidase family protein [Solobacterium sp.]|nr:D-alanyl-D-alanine carboxypeptidase family protein [Solobacterium sp.]